MSSVRSICEKRGLDLLTQNPTGTISLAYDVLINLVSVSEMLNVELMFLDCIVLCVFNDKTFFID